jgi:IclR helix-turn-helix domain
MATITAPSNATMSKVRLALGTDPVGVKAVAETTGLSDATVRRALTKLVTDGLANKEGNSYTASAAVGDVDLPVLNELMAPLTKPAKKSGKKPAAKKAAAAKKAPAPIIGEVTAPVRMGKAPEDPGKPADGGQTVIHPGSWVIHDRDCHFAKRSDKYVPYTNVWADKLGAQALKNSCLRDGVRSRIHPTTGRVTK